MKNLKDTPLPLGKKRTAFFIRCFDIAFSFSALFFFSPLLIFIAVLVKFTSKGTIIFQQVRVGKDDKDFLLFKFRTMIVNADAQGLLTVGGKDKRITGLGYFLRKYKLDELPQLWNVLKGNMSIVGPRPEVRKYVTLYTEKQRQVLSVKPGLTDYASIEFRNESEILSAVSKPEEYYIKHVLPRKIELNKYYINNKTIKEYFEVIIKTQFSLYDFRNFLIRNKIHPKWGIFLIDILASVIAMIFANFLLHKPGYFQHNLIPSVFVTGATCSAFFFILKPYDGIIRYSDVQEAFKIFGAIFFSLGLLLVINYVPVLNNAAPFFGSSSLIVFFFIAFVFMLGYRLLIKAFYYLSVTDKSFNLKPDFNSKTKLQEVLQQNFKQQSDVLLRKKILVTGAAGSIGRELAKQLMSFDPISLILCDSFETGLHILSHELQTHLNSASSPVRTFVGDVKDRHSMNRLFNTYQPDIVFHAAENKYTDLMELHPSEVVHNNIEGTKLVADLSAIYHVERFLLITRVNNKDFLNIAEASKQIAELYCSFMPNNMSFSFKEPFIYNLHKKKVETKFITVYLPDVFVAEEYKLSGNINHQKNNNLIAAPLNIAIPYFISLKQACTMLLQAVATGANTEAFEVNRIVNNNYLIAEKQNILSPVTYELAKAKARDYNFSWSINNIHHLLNLAKEQNDIDVLKQVKKMVPSYDINNNPLYKKTEQHNRAVRIAG